MMAGQYQRFTPDEFDKFILLPENRDHIFELINGWAVQKQPHAYYSLMTVEVSTQIIGYMQHQGCVTGPDGSYALAGERYVPDVAFLNEQRKLPDMSIWHYPEAPDLAVEIVAPHEDQRLLTIKIMNYLASGTVVWAIYPDAKDACIFTPGQAVQIIRSDGVITGGDVLPGFKLPIRQIFPAEPEPTNPTG